MTTPRFQLNKDNLQEFLLTLRSFSVISNDEMARMLEVALAGDCLSPSQLPTIAKSYWVADLGSFQAPKAFWLEFLTARKRMEDTDLLRSLRFGRSRECLQAGCLNPLHWRFNPKKSGGGEGSSLEIFLLSKLLKNPDLCSPEQAEEAQQKLTKIVLGLIKDGVPMDLPAMQQLLKGEENV